MGGIYLNGGYSFDNSLFIDGRLSSLANDNRGSADAVLGLGYYFAFTPDIDFYTVVGASRHALVFDASKDGKKPILITVLAVKLGLKPNYHQILA